VLRSLGRLNCDGVSWCPELLDKSYSSLRNV
jgi:hypothetical protein